MSKYSELKNRVESLDAQCTENRSAVHQSKNNLVTGIHGKLTSGPTLATSFSLGFLLGPKGSSSQSAGEHGKTEPRSLFDRVKAPLFLMAVRSYIDAV